MFRGRSASVTWASAASGSQSLRWNGSTMWKRKLATNASTAATRMGTRSDINETIVASVGADCTRPSRGAGRQDGGAEAELLVEALFQVAPSLQRLILDFELVELVEDRIGSAWARRSLPAIASLTIRSTSGAMMSRWNSTRTSASTPRVKGW